MAQQQHDLLPPILAIDEEPFTDAEYDQYAREGSPDNAVARFVVDNDDLAEWAMAHVAQLDSELDALRDRRTAYLERIESWFARDADRLANKREFFAMHLRAYLREIREADPATKSISLPSGKITSHGSKARVVITNDDEALRYVKGNFDPQVVQDAVKVTEKLLVSGLKGVVVVEDGRAVDAETHNPVPGCGVEPEGVKYDVKPD